MKTIRTSAGILIIAFVAIIISIFSGGCAQIGMPVGGPRDSIPPVLQQATPPNFSTNFKGNRISLVFDEYVQLDNPLQNVVISPLPRKSPFIDFKLKTVTIRLFDTLQPNTTYSFQFGNTIRDLNENNPLKGFEYVYSTGSTIDSLTLEGDVFIAESGAIDSSLTVLLYKDLSDSAILKHKPDYIAKINGKGHFEFKYLAPGHYHIYSLKAEGGQYIYSSPRQLFAFADSIVSPSIDTKTPITLFAYQEEKEVPKETPPKADEKLKFVTTISGETQDMLTPLRVTFNRPVKVDTASIALTDTLHKKIQGVAFSLDTTQKILSLTYPWPGSTNYELVIPENSVQDTLGNKLAKDDTLRFRTKNESDYGSIKLSFQNLSKYADPLLQLVNEQGDVKTYPIAGNTFQLKLIYPGTYHIQILEDVNKNGKWDTGNYEKKTQPEKVHRISQTISIRANWDNERDIVL